MNIGFIGLGVMGNPIGSNLVRDGGYNVSVFDIHTECADNLVEMGALRAKSVAQAVEGANVIMTSLPGPDQIEAVAFDDAGLFANIQAGAVWIDLSTSNLELCKRIAACATEQKVDYLDAPVSGGDEGARAGNLSILVGGEKAVFERYLPVLQVIGERITYLGPSAAGCCAKIAQVVLCYLHSLALSEALMLGIKGGIEASEMLSIIQNSTGRSYVAQHYGPPILRGDYDPSFTLGLAHKDMKLAQAMADDLGLRLPMCDLTTEIYARALEQYGFDANHLKAVRLLENDNKTFLRE